MATSVVRCDQTIKVWLSSGCLEVIDMKEGEIIVHSS